MSKNPAFLFYPNDFIAGTNLMTNEQVGKYIRLLCYQYGQGHLSEEDMLVVCGSYDKKIFSKFKQDEDGNYYNERLEEEVLKRKAYSDSRSENIKKRWENSPKSSANVSQNEYICNTLVSPSVLHMGNENINDNKNNNINIDNNLYFQRFNIFWEKYPKKRDKAKAQKSFLRLKPSDELLSQMLNAIEQQKRTKQWQDKEFIPYPSTWLNGERWNDEVGGGGYDYNDIPDAFKVGEYI